MTTTHPQATGGLDRGWPTYAGLGIGVSMLLTLVGTFTNLAGEAEEGGHTAGESLVVVGMILIGALIVFGLVAKAVAPANAGLFAVSFGVVGLVSLLVFWTGLPAVLSAGALACVAVEGRSGAPRSVAAKTAMVLAVVVLALAVTAAIFG